MYIDDVLPLTCSEHRDMKMVTLSDISSDEIIRVICAILNTSQTEVNRHHSGVGTTSVMQFIIMQRHIHLSLIHI